MYLFFTGVYIATICICFLFVNIKNQKISKRLIH